MKKLLFLLFVSSLFISCNDDDNDPQTLVGSWRLTAVWLDPGDGSGEFQSVTDGSTLNFSSDGETVTISTSFCNATNENTATYSEVDGTITLPECGNFTPYTIYFEIIASDLILSYPCIEACQYKYNKQ